MQKINYSEFTDFFQTEIVPVIQPYEAERKRVARTTKYLKIASSICAVIVCLFDIIHSHDEIFFTIAIIAVFIFVIGTVIMSNYKSKMKNRFYGKIFNLLGLKHSIDPREQFDIKNQIFQICRKTGIYSRYDCITSDDIISGDYNNLPFVVSDVEISYESGYGRSRQKVVVLKGLFLAIKTDKNYKGETIIKTDTFMQAKELKGKKVVKLEDVEFEKHFEVYGTDQIESRYLLTPSFMQRLLDYKLTKQYRIEVVFSKEISSDQNMFFFIHTDKDHFELPKDMTLLDQYVFYDLIKDITEILEIVDALKLDQNIGL